MTCNCPSCRPPRWLSRRDWLISITLALGAMLLRVLIWAWWPGLAGWGG